MSSSPRSILVTGADGFIGVPVTRLLLAAGHEVHTLSNDALGTAARLDELDGDLHRHEADVRDADAVRRVVGEANPWGAIHLAALHFIPWCIARPAEALAINVLGTQHLLDALAESDAERLVFASTGDVYRPSESAHHEDDPTEPFNVYGATKLTGEALLKFHGERDPSFLAVVARLFNAIGPGETNPHVVPAIFSALREGDVLALGNTSPRRDYTYVEDIAAALTGLLERASEPVTVNIGAGRRVSVDELIERIGSITGRDLRVETDPARVRKVERPVLQADNRRLLELVPDLRWTELDVGLRRTLEDEDLL